MLLRTWAIWGRSRRIFIFLSVLLMVCGLGASAPALYMSLTVTEIPSLDSIRPCQDVFPNPDVLYGIWASFIAFDSTVMTLTLIKVLPIWKSSGLTPLVNQLLKDGIQYFIMIFLIVIAGIVTTAVASDAFGTTVFSLYTAMTSTLGSRLILNLRGWILRPRHNDDGEAIDLQPLVLISDQSVGARGLV